VPRLKISPRTDHVTVTIDAPEIFRHDVPRSYFWDPKTKLFGTAQRKDCTADRGNNPPYVGAVSSSLSLWLPIRQTQQNVLVAKFYAQNFTFHPLMRSLAPPINQKDLILVTASHFNTRSTLKNMAATRTTAAVVLKIRTPYVVAAAECSSGKGFPYLKSPHALFINKQQRGRTYGTAAPRTIRSFVTASEQQRNKKPSLVPEPVRGTSKLFKNADEAVADIKSGSTILSAGFGLCGTAGKWPPHSFGIGFVGGTDERDPTRNHNSGDTSPRN